MEKKRAGKVFCYLYRRGRHLTNLSFRDFLFNVYTLLRHIKLQTYIRLEERGRGREFWEIEGTSIIIIEGYDFGVPIL